MSGQQKTKQLAKIISKLLVLVGADVSRNGLKETPQRVAKMYQEVLSGYSQNSQALFKSFHAEQFRGL